MAGSFFWWYNYPVIQADSDPITGTPSGLFYRVGPENRLPQWVRGFNDPTSLTYQLLRSAVEPSVLFGSWARRVYRQAWLSTADITEPRLEWLAPASLPPDREATIRYHATTLLGEVSGAVRRAVSPFDYLTAVDPVWWLDPRTRQLSLRNLAMRQSVVTSPDTVYTIGGEPAGIIADHGLYFRINPRQMWEWVDPEAALSGNEITLPLSGSVFLTYGSQDLFQGLLAGGQIVISWENAETPRLPLTVRFLGNSFDAYGLLVGLPRIPHEDNGHYRERLLAWLEAPADSTRDGVKRGIAGRLGLLFRTDWDGVSTLVLDPDNTRQITSIHVVGVPRYRQIDETLTPAPGNQVFFSSYGSWRAGALVLVDGVPEPNVSVSGSRVTLSRPVTGTVTASYSLEQYSSSLTPSGSLQSLVAGTGIASGSYVVISTRDVDVHGVAQEVYQRAALLTPEGLPGGLFLDLARRVQADNKAAFARARWGQGAAWLEEQGDHPSQSRLPLPFDRAEGIE